MIKKYIYNKNKFFKKIKFSLKKKLSKNFFIKNNLVTNERLKKLISFQNKINFHIIIKIIPNNIFCTVKHVYKSASVKTLLVLSAGILKLKISKKKLKYSSKIFIEKILNFINRFLKHQTLLVRITGPVKIKKKIIRFLTKRLRKNNNLFVQIQEKKCFNGCLSKKKKRKKRRKFRNFKSK